MPRTHHDRSIGAQLKPYHVSLDPKPSQKVIGRLAVK